MYMRPFYVKYKFLLIYVAVMCGLAKESLCTASQLWSILVSLMWACRSLLTYDAVMCGLAKESLCTASQLWSILISWMWVIRSLLTYDAVMCGLAKESPCTACSAVIWCGLLNVSMKVSFDIWCSHVWFSKGVTMYSMLSCDLMWSLECEYEGLFWHMMQSCVS